MIITSAQEEFWELYKGLPQELKDAVSSAKTARTIERVCEKNTITDERVGQIADIVGNVVLGLIKPHEFEETLRKEVGLPTEMARAVARELDRFIFYPVKPALEELHRIVAEKPKGAQEVIRPEEPKQRIVLEVESVEESLPRKPLKENQKDTPQNATDAYRESIE